MIDKAMLAAEPSDILSTPMASYPVQTRNTVMHRIIQGAEGHMWFTEMQADEVGKVVIALPQPLTD